MPECGRGETAGGALAGRKLSYGSHSECNADLQGILLAVFGTLSLAGLDLQRWLRALARPRPISASPATDPPSVLPLPDSLDKVRPLRFDPLRPKDPRSRIWNEFVDRYHYLGHKNLPGAQLRYFVHARDGLPLALLAQVERCLPANWLHLGQTLGRGKLDTHNEFALPIKDIFVKPLCADWKAVLNR